MQIKFTLDKGAYKPEKAHAADAGYDLRMPGNADTWSVTLFGLVGNVCIDTGVHVAIPEGYVGYVQGRSGLNINHSIICPTGTIDAGFTGSIAVKLYNKGEREYILHAGDKIAQLIIQPLADTEFVEVEELEDSERGNNGFGSTGR